MEEGRGVKVCGAPNYRIIFPRITNFCLKNFKNAVDFHPKEKWPCRNSWDKDPKPPHIRNRRLLDLAFTEPKCCTDIYNIVNDRQKLKKLKRYGLTRAVRTMVYDTEVEEFIGCQSEGESAEDVKITRFPECYIVSESESSDDEDDEYKTCESGSESECSGCSTLEGGMKRKLHKVVKKTWRDLLHRSPEQICKTITEEQLARHKQMKGLE